MNHEQIMQSIERRRLFLAIRRCAGNRTMAARVLGMTYRAFRYRARVLGLAVQSVAAVRDRFAREWPGLRLLALRKHGHKCQSCGATPADGATLHVDHVIPRHLMPALELELENLQVLCRDCNVAKGRKLVMDCRPSAYA